MASPISGRPQNGNGLVVYHDSGAGLPSPKRRKTNVACALCRLRKSKCDGARPRCGPCIKRKRPPIACMYPETGHSPEEERILSHASCEPLNHESTHSPSSKSTPNTYVNEDRRDGRLKSMTRLSVPTSDAIDQQPPGIGQQLPTHLHFAEDPSGDNDAMGNVDNWGLKAGLYGASSSVTFMHSICNLVEGYKNSHYNIQGHSVNSTLRRALYRPRAPMSGTHSTECVLPPRRTADRLLDIHWNYSHVVFPFVDRLRLMRWYEGLWTGQEQPGLYDEQAYYCILNIIFAISYKIDPTTRPEEQERLSDAHFVRAQKFLYWNLLDISHIELIQALLLMAQYLQSTNLPRAFFESIGLAIWVAQNMGFHIAGRISTFLNEHECEIARRVWHGCVLFDRIASVNLGRTLRISPELARQSSLPAAVDDEYLNTEGFENGLQPSAQPSEMGFYVAYCELHLILGDILSTIYAPRSPSGQATPLGYTQCVIPTGKQSIDDLVQFEKSLNRWRSELPPHLRLEADFRINRGTLVFRRQAVGLCLRFLHVRMLLYRPFFSDSAEGAAATMNETTGFPEPQLAETILLHGLTACVAAAQQMLELISCHLNTAEQPGLLPPWWHVIAYVYTSATIVIAAHVFPSILVQVSLDALTASVRQGFSILEHFKGDRKSARRCKAALDVLYNKVMAPTNGRQSPTAAQVKTGRSGCDPDIDIALPATFGHDASVFNFGDENELFWLNSIPFDRDNNFWL